MRSLVIFVGFVWLSYSLGLGLSAIASAIAGICK